MRAFRPLSAVAGVLLTAMAATAAPVPASASRTESPAATARRALDEVSDFSYQARALIDVVADVKERTKGAVTLDPGIMNFGIDPSQPTVNVELKRVKLRDALKAILGPHNLRVGIVREGLYISNEEGVTAHQLRQSVSVDCDGTPFDKAIASLTGDSGANVVIDPRLKEKAAVPVVLKLEEVPMETAIRLLSEVADLRAVRMNNVLFVTTPERAKSLRPDADGPLPPAQPSPGFQQLNPGGVFGIGGAVGGVLPGAPVPVQAVPVPEKAEEKK
jgi:hypothetical protein